MHANHRIKIIIIDSLDSINVAALACDAGFYVGLIGFFVWFRPASFVKRSI